MNEKRALLAKATGLLKVLERMEIPLDVLEDDSTALTLIEATQLAIMLDEKTRRPTRLKAAMDLAKVRGLDKQSRVAEAERSIRRIREGLKLKQEKVIDTSFVVEGDDTESDLAENSPDPQKIN